MEKRCLWFLKEEIIIGAKDNATKNYMADNSVFADAFNYLIYEGEQVIQAENLQEMDSTVVYVPTDKKKKQNSYQKIRDGLKCLTAMKDDQAVYLLLGIENQSDIHYAMPVRNMIYDALQYGMQIEKIAQLHHKDKMRVEKLDTKPSSGEFLTGFYKEDILIPVITLVIYFGSEHWDGPVRLKEMFQIKDEKILSFVQDYQIHLICPGVMKDEELCKLKSSLREVLLFIKYAKDKQKLGQLLENDEKYRSLDRKAVQVVKEVTGLKLELDAEKETIDMCQAWEEMRQDCLIEGNIKGYIAAYNEIGLSKEDILMKVIDKFKISLDEAEQLVEALYGW